jgi:hypothetical protein
VSCGHRGRVVVIPVIVEPVVVPVPPIAVPIQVTDVEVAIGVAVLYKISSVPPPFEGFPISGLNRIWHLIQQDDLLGIMP